MTRRRNDRKAIRRKEAQARDFQDSFRSPSDKWCRLNDRLGTDRGAMLERAKLYLAIESRQDDRWNWV